MLRKLLFSVLVFSLFLAFTGTAFSDTRRPDNTGVDVRTKTAPAAERNLPSPDKWRDGLNTQTARTFTLQSEGTDVPYPSPYAPDHECEVLDLADYGGSFWTVGTFTGADNGLHVANRFEVQQFHNAVVYGAAVRIYAVSANGVDLNFYVWDDAGGVPGALLYTETVPAATLVGLGPGHWLFSFATGVAVPGGAYHISYDVGPNDPAESITPGFNTDASGGEHGATHWSFDGGVTWLSSTDAVGGPLNARLSSDVCYVFNDCYATAIPDLSWFGPIGLPMDNGDGTVWTGLTQRHVAVNDTLKTVTFSHLDQGSAPPLYAGTNETNGVIVEVWGDNAGALDWGAGPLASVNVPGGIANLFPSGGGGLGTWNTENVTVDVSSFGLIFRGNFHVSWRMDGVDPADGALVPLLLGGGGGGGYIDADGITNDIAWWSPSSHSMTINVELCRDEYQECQHQVLYNGDDWGTTFSLAYDADGDGAYEPPFPASTGDGNYDEVAQKVAGRTFNRVEGASFMVANNYWYSALPIGDFEVVFRVYADLAGEPGAVTWESAPIPVSDASAWDPYGQLWVDVVIPDVLTNGDFWVGFKATNLGGTTLSRLRAPNDGTWGPGHVNGGSWLYYIPFQAWISTELFAGDHTGDDWWITVDMCSIPEPEWACGVTDWGTLQHDFQRTGHAGVGLGNVKCDLTLEWAYMHPTGKYGQFTGPIIYNNTIVGTFRSNTGTEYKTFDLITKVEGYTLTMAGNVTGMPTVANIGGTDMMFVSGGTKEQIVRAYDFATGTLIWEIGTTNALGLALPMGANEVNPYANFIIWNDGTDDVLYFSVDIGKIYAVHAVDGTPYWAGPYVPSGFGSVSNRTGTLGTGDADGILFYGFGSVVGGNIAAIDATDGSLVWDLAGGEGLQGNTAWGGGVTIEQFAAGMAFDPIDGALYAVSTCSGAAPIAGTLYQLDGVTGSLVNPAQPVNGVSNAVTPVMDVQNVLVPTRSAWNEGINNPYVLQVYRKSDLTLQFGTGYGVRSADDFMVADMVMSCEVEANDYIFFFGRRGVLHAIDGNTGDDLFARRITDQTFGGAAGALALDTDGFPHLVFQDASGGVYDLTPQTSRARLDVLRGNDAENSARAAVPFGSDPNFECVFTSIFRNTGCEDLEVEMTISETSNGAPTIPYRAVAEDFGNNAIEMAQDLSYHSPFKLKDAQSVVEYADYDETATFEKSVPVNPAALALGFINNDVIYDTVPGDDQPVDVHVFVDQPAVGRGVFPRYMAFTQYNDPDFWLDDATLGPIPPPEVMLTFLGGCVLETADLFFGYDQENEQVVFNSGRLVENGLGDFTIDGVTGVLFQGYYLFGVSQHRWAFTIVSWLEGSGETSTWNGWLPELIDGQCVPVLTEGVSLGYYSYTGADGYVNEIIGNQVEYNSIDSVQNFADPGEPDGWNHANFIAPFDNDSTMGLTIHHKTIGAYEFDADLLTAGALDDIGNATIEIFDFTERNGNAVPNWKFASYLDWDCRLTGAGVDTTRNARKASMSWTYDYKQAGARVIGGQIKIPFNFCSNTADPNYLPPLKTGLSIDQAQGMWGTIGSGGNDVWFLDSVWFYSNLPWDSAEYSQAALPANEDQAGAYILAEHDFAPNETFRVAVANFQFQGYTTPTSYTGRHAKLAYTLNKWMGFGRGDVNNDNKIDMMDIIYTSNYVAGGPGPIPFEYLGDVNVDGVTNALDVTAIANFYFNEGGCFGGEWQL